MTTSDLAKLRTAAEDALRLNDGNVTKAAPKLARTLIENAKRPLLVALVADYLARLPAVPKTPPQRKPPPKPACRRRKRELGRWPRSELRQMQSSAAKSAARDRSETFACMSSAPSRSTGAARSKRMFQSGAATGTIQFALRCLAQSNRKGGYRESTRHVGNGNARGRRNRSRRGQWTECAGSAGSLRCR